MSLPELQSHSPRPRNRSGEHDPDRLAASGWRQVDEGARTPQGSYDHLGANYIPDKLATNAKTFGAEARRRSRHQAGWGAAGGRAKSRHGSTTYSIDQDDDASEATVDHVLSTSGRRQSHLTSFDGNDASRAERRDDGIRSSVHDDARRASKTSLRILAEDEGADSHGLRESKSLYVIPSISAGEEGHKGKRGDFDFGRERLAKDDVTKEQKSARDLAPSLDRSSTFSHQEKPLRGIIDLSQWNKFKWCLVVGNTALTIYAVVGFVTTLLAWANFYSNASVFLIVNRREIILCTTAAILCLVSSLFGWMGILLNNRAFLTVYTVLLWVSLATAVAPGYLTYKRRTFNLPGKMNFLWSHLSLEERRLTQIVLQCCGYYSPFIEAASDSERCYARSVLPGCKGPLIALQRRVLTNVYAVIFALVGPHLLVIVIALLCSNHITYRFGKGKTPKPYRLDIDVLRQAFEKQLLETPVDRARAWQHVSTESLQPLDPLLAPPKPPFWSTAT